MAVNKRILKKSKFWERISKLSFDLSMVYFRKAWLVNGLNRKTEKSKGYPIDDEAIKKVWHGIKINKNWLRFYNSIERGEDRSFDPRYLPLDIQYCFIDDWFNNTQEALMLDDKNWYDLFFFDVNRPKTIARIIGHAYFDPEYNNITLDEVVERCVSEKQVILKPTVDSSGGRGIEFWDNSQSQEVLKNFLQKHNNYVIQSIIRQNEEINKIYPHSVNSIRIVTCNYEGTTSVLSAVIRMGVDGNKLDNASKGGLFCGIDENGRLRKYAYTKYGDTFSTHPQGAVFADCHIPNYDKCKELVIRLSNRFLRISRLISWDLAIDENGEPTLIEVNLCYGGTDIHQIANGPLYGNKTEAILDKVFRKSKKYRVLNRLIHS